MMKWTVRQVAEAKGIKNARDLADRIGASYSSIYPIWDGSAKRADLATLNKLCNLLDVPIGMLLVHMPDESNGPMSETGNKPRRTVSAKPKRESKRTRAAGVSVR